MDNLDYGAKTIGTYEVRPYSLIVNQIGEPMFSEMATIVELCDEAAGEFVRVRQQSGHVDAKKQEILINKNEWPALSAAIDCMISHCREERN